MAWMPSFSRMPATRAPWPCSCADPTWSHPATTPPHRVDIPSATRPPLTPFVLAAAYSIFGPHLLAGQLLLATLGALTTVAVYHLGKDLFSREVAVLAGFFTA